MTVFSKEDVEDTFNDYVFDPDDEVYDVQFVKIDGKWLLLGDVIEDIDVHCLGFEI
jgi:hypothetical protein